MTDVIDEIAPGLGHNMESGLPSIEEINALLEANNIEALKRVEALVEKAPTFYTITCDEDDSAATEFMVKNRARWKASEADRVAAKAPYDDRASAVQQFFKTKILDRLTEIGTKINKAQTDYKVKKAEDEKKVREAEAKRLRLIEEEANRKRAVEEAERRAEEDRKTALIREAARLAQAEADALALAASRKRNDDTRAAAAAETAAARLRALDAAATQRIEDERIANERAERDAANLLEENRLAENRAQAEEHANVSLADLSRNRGEKGGVSSLKQSVSWRDINRDTLDYAALGPYFKDAHLDTALKAYSDANKALVHTGIKTGKQPVKGVTFYLKAANSGRA